MDSRKQAICDALRAFIEQRPGFEFANYGDWLRASFRREFGHGIATRYFQ